MPRPALALAAALALAGCAEPPLVPVPDYSAIDPRVVQDACPTRSTLPALGPDGWPTCSALTRADAVRQVTLIEIVEAAPTRAR